MCVNKEIADWIPVHILEHILDREGVHERNVSPILEHEASGKRYKNKVYEITKHNTVLTFLVNKI